jgi:hypothetical protein
MAPYRKAKDSIAIKYSLAEPDPIKLLGKCSSRSTPTGRTFRFPLDGSVRVERDPRRRP